MENEQSTARGAGDVDTARHERSAAGTAVAVGVCVVVGALVTVQTKINGELGARLGDGLRAGLGAAVVSFGGGLVLLSILMVAYRPARSGPAAMIGAVRTGRLRWWHLVGGIGGASLVASQGITAATLGVALFAVAVVAGQSSSALAVDHIGLGPAGRSPVSPPRVVGAALAIVAVVCGSADRMTGTNALAWSAIALALLPIAAGAATSWQQAVNGRVAQVTGPWPATWNNFVVGTTILLVAFALSFLAPGHLNSLPTEPWLYVGGIIGIGFIAAGTILVRTLGVLVFGLGSIAGQLVGAVIVDLVTDPGHLGMLSILGVALTLLGVVVATVGDARRRA